jgi:hypothetical protein
MPENSIRPMILRPTLCRVETTATADAVPRSDPNGFDATVAGTPL